MPPERNSYREVRRWSENQEDPRNDPANREPVDTHIPWSLEEPERANNHVEQSCSEAELKAKPDEYRVKES